MPMMLVEEASNLVPAGPAIAIAVVAFAAFAEAMPIIGLVVPASVMVIGTATTAAIEGWPMWPLVLVATIGAWAGDSVSYFLGHRYRRSILDMKFMRRQRWSVSVARVLLNRYGLWAVLVARFIPGLRAILPLLAGVFRMRQLPFQIGNSVSAVAWAFLNVMPGPIIAYVITPLLERGSSLPVVIGVVVLVVVVMAVHWWVRRRPAEPVPMTAAAARRKGCDRIWRGRARPYAPH